MRNQLLVRLAAGAVAVGALTAGQARALVVNVPGYGDWDVTFFAGSYGDNIGKFANLPAPGVMPWWGSSAAAASFAAAVGDSLASPNFGNFGPYFAYDSRTVLFGQPSVERPIVDVFAYETATGNTIQTFTFQSSQSSNRSSWAQATAVPSSVPGPLPALGAAAAFGYSRRLRRRIMATTNNVTTAPFA